MKFFINFFAIIFGIFLLIFLPDFIFYPIIEANEFFLFSFFKIFYTTKIENEFLEINSYKILIDKKCTFLIPLILTFPTVLINSRIEKIFLFIFLIISLSISRQIFEIFLLIEFNLYFSIFSDIQNIILPIFIYSIFLKKSIQQLKLSRIE
jgi:hypothetical protein